jgi:hypothetical protein
MASEACLQNPGSCDSFMIPYCKTLAGKADPTCACINSKLNGTSYQPMCSDLDCINGGYATKNMAAAIAAGCPTITNCTQYATYISTGLITNIDPTQKQTCGTEGGVGTSTSSSTTQTASTNPAIAALAAQSNQSNMTMTYIAIGAFILLVIYIIKR